MTRFEGSPRSAGIDPTDAEDLQSFLEEYEDAPAFEVVIDDGTERSRLVADLDLDERSANRPAAKTAFRCVLLPVSEGAEYVAFEKIRRVHTTEPPAELLAPDTEDPRDRARALRALAIVDPERVDVADVIDVIATPEIGDELDRYQEALDALERLVARRPDDCTAGLPRLIELLESPPRGAVEMATLEAIATIGEERPGEIAPYVAEIRPYLTAETDDCRASAARCLGHIARQDAADVVEAAPDLLQHVEERSEGIYYAVYGLTAIADTQPAAVKPAVTTLQELLTEDEHTASLLSNAASAIGRVANEFPDAATGAVAPLCTLLDGDTPKLRANAAGALADIATLRADLLAPRVDTLTPLLEANDEYTLANVASALGRVAETSPERVEHLTGQFRDLLQHDDELVRVNACWALGRLQASEAVDALEERRIEDDSARVRNRALWALAEIEPPEAS